MKEKILIPLFFMGLNLYSMDIPYSIGLKLGYMNSINEKSYHGMEIESSFQAYSFTETINLTIEPYIYFLDSFKFADPGIMFALNKKFPINENWGFIASAGIAGMYMSNDRTDQHIGFNFMEKIEGGIYRNLPNNFVVSLKSTFWHISHGGLHKNNNPGINGYKILIGFEKKF